MSNSQTAFIGVDCEVSTCKNCNIQYVLFHYSGEDEKRLIPQTDCRGFCPYCGTKVAKGE